MQGRADAPADAPGRAALAARVHGLKNAFYAEIIAAEGVPLRPGVSELLDDCERAGIPFAIATTTSRQNVDALLRRHFGTAWRCRFRGVHCAEDAPQKKPDPLVYRLALRTLGLAPDHVVAIEDSPAGVQAARAASIPVIVARSVYFAAADMSGALAVGPSLGCVEGWDPPAHGRGNGRVDLAQIAQWHSGR
jgi:HAD superfamily hydrolase (TIGR01509 family)